MQVSEVMFGRAGYNLRVESASMTEVHMLKKSLRRGARNKAPDQPPTSPQTPAADQSSASPQTPATEYATLGPDAPIAWPSGARRVPVTGQLSPHAAAALQRMGITQTRE
jgi:hypothetical protein